MVDGWVFVLDVDVARQEEEEEQQWVWLERTRCGQKMSLQSLSKRFFSGGQSSNPCLAVSCRGGAL
jgi:hypothetical protein